jgi:hypothetical protein
MDETEKLERVVTDMTFYEWNKERNFRILRIQTEAGTRLHNV